ncbi:MAG: class I SAM-dependent methyltransferase [Rivularia sp. (in: cyanobacteria)]
MKQIEDSYGDYQVQDVEKNLNLYNDWAKNYEKDHFDGGYNSPQFSVELLSKYIHKESKILDVGAGTGLIGENFVKLGYRNIEAMDMNEKMLSQAKTKNIYQGFHQQIMGKTLDFPNHAFDAISGVGVFTFGHAPAKSFDELVRITKPGGYIMFTIRPEVYETAGFKEKMTELEEAGKWGHLEVSDKYACLPTADPNFLVQVWIYQVK